MDEPATGGAGGSRDLTPDVIRVSWVGGRPGEVGGDVRGDVNC